VHHILVNVYERSIIARIKCIAHYGLVCFICSFDFDETYGEAGKDYIHVHHFQQPAEIGEKYQIDPTVIYARFVHLSFWLFPE
jgi:5-methylcytosine-specific restriction protein A